ncbi:peroxide stress protein YaaA [Streptococcus orisratti]
MITFLIPTAKEMKILTQSSHKPLTSKSSAIAHELAKLSTDELARCYKLSLPAAEEEAKRWALLVTNQAANYPALHLFNGLMYRHIVREELSTDELAYLDEHIFITSALYGIIPVRESIAAHRLDFNTPFKIDGKSLKAFWRKEFDNFVTNNKVVISLLSSEFEEVFSTSVRKNFVNLIFMEEKDGQLKKHSTISKKARGQFLTAAVKASVETVTEIKSLIFGGFSYRPDLSTEKQLVFVKVVS